MCNGWMYVMLQKKRRSGFGASDELSSEEEEGVQPMEVMRPPLHQDRHHYSTAAPCPTPASVPSVRKRKSNPKPTLRPQVKVLFDAKMFLMHAVDKHFSAKGIKLEFEKEEVVRIE